MGKAKLSFESIAGGAAQEAIDFEFNEVMANIQDVNTDATKPRKLIVEMTFKSDENRQIISVNTAVKTKLMPTESVNTNLVVRRTKDGLQIEELMGSDPNQVTLYEEEDNKKIVKMEGAN